MSRPRRTVYLVSISILALLLHRAGIDWVIFSGLSVRIPGPELFSATVGSYTLCIASSSGWDPAWATLLCIAAPFALVSYLLYREADAICAWAKQLRQSERRHTAVRHSLLWVSLALLVATLVTEGHPAALIPMLLVFPFALVYFFNLPHARRIEEEAASSGQEADGTSAR